MKVEGPDMYLEDISLSVLPIVPTCICGVEVEWCMAGQSFGANAAVVAGDGAVDATILGDMALVMPSLQRPAVLPDLADGLLGSSRWEPLVGSMPDGR